MARVFMPGGVNSPARACRSVGCDPVFISAGAGTGIAGLPDDPALRALYQERLEIQEQIEGLQATRGGTDEAIYQAEMEKLLVAMALKGREIREMEDSVAEPPREP